jgi:hypothetical protein
MIVEAKRRFPCRIKLGVPIGGFGERLTEMRAWLDQNCGAHGWAMTPAGLRCRQRCGRDIFSRRDAGHGFWGEMVRRISGRDQRRGLPSERESAGAKECGGAAQDVLRVASHRCLRSSCLEYRAGLFR